MGGVCGPERLAFWWVCRSLAVMLETNSARPGRLSQTSRSCAHGWREGMGFVIPPMCFSVTPHFQYHASLLCSLVFKFFSGHLGSHFGQCPICFFFPPFPSAFTLLYCGFSNLLHQLQLLHLLPTFQKFLWISHFFDHSLYCWFKPFWFHCYNFTEVSGERCEILYVLSTALSLHWNIWKEMRTVGWEVGDFPIFHRYLTAPFTFVWASTVS